LANFYGILLIGTLVVASGVIAYVGDIVGRRMGRKRLSLFGLRPRHTAIAISVVAGMLITMFTLAVAMLASQDVRQGLLNVVEMRRQQADLGRKLSDMKERVAYLDQSRQQAARKEAEARQRAEAAAQARQQAEAGRQKAEEERKKAEEEWHRAEAEAKKARADVQKAGEVYRDAVLRYHLLRRQSEEFAARATGALLKERAEPVLVVAGEPLGVELIQGGQSKPAIRAQLNELLARLAATARQAGAAPLPGTDDVVVLDKLVPDPKTGGVAKFTKQQVLVAVTNTIAGERGAVIARAESAINSYSGEPIYADIKLYNNRLVYRKGEVLAEAVVDGSRPQPALMNALVGLLKAKVGPDAKRKNMMPRITSTGSDPFGSSGSTVGEMSYDQLFEKIGELRRIGGPAKVVVFAAEDAWTIGPLTVDMRVEPVTG
jgi:uncharacterized protein (DUF3084 family)